ncbi:arsenate reductase (glutaredoxin) [Aquimarina addita]|uniref:Arsenate reductase (Glutaredoxin) n=1 Tax=Aquimarina addita TaxID=870485 RepID=A0ABP6UXA3_9FLAO
MEEQKEEVTNIKYLDTPLIKEQLTEIIQLLNIQPKELIRTNETIWKEKFKGKDMTDDELIKAMCEHPKLIERPIVIKNNKAIIGRPPEKVTEILK